MSCPANKQIVELMRDDITNFGMVNCEGSHNVAETKNWKSLLAVGMLLGARMTLSKLPGQFDSEAEFAHYVEKHMMRDMGTYSKLVALGEELQCMFGDEVDVDLLIHGVTMEPDDEKAKVIIEEALKNARKESKKDDHAPSGGSPQG